MSQGTLDREYWLQILDKISRPVLTSLNQRRLKEKMPIEGRDDKSACAYLEALGRLLVGIAPWLELGINNGEEGGLRREFANMAREAINAATDPESPDYMNVDNDKQALVDAAFLANAIIRAPEELWGKLDTRIRSNLLNILKRTRKYLPYYNNWLLFSAMVETFLFRVGEDWDRMRVDYALKQHENWYLGDGIYGDGPQFHWNYYNSFVIQPMLIDIIETVAEEHESWKLLKDKIISRAIRYAEIQERMISPEGTFPPVGRSLAYRFGVFHLLGQMALREELPEKILPAQVRCALTAVIKRMMEMAGTFDKDGWLTIGFAGHQPAIGERYISTGSLYLCSTGLLPLGLSEKDSFWQGEEDWSSRKIWSGKDIENDYNL